MRLGLRLGSGSGSGSGLGLGLELGLGLRLGLGLSEINHKCTHRFKSEIVFFHELSMWQCFGLARPEVVVHVSCE